MTELALDPPFDADEKTMLELFLDFQRSVMIRKAEGISLGDAARTPTPSSLSLLGMVKHLAYVERWWFQICFAGEDVTHVSTDDDLDADFRIEPGETVEGIIDLYRGEIERSREITKAAGLDEIAKKSSRRGHASLRWILVHMIEETARHAGHADIIREAIDGATGD
jgi:uncharacterized protein DUF664